MSEEEDRRDEKPAVPGSERDEREKSQGRKNHYRRTPGEPKSAVRFSPSPQPVGDGEGTIRDGIAAEPDVVVRNVVLRSVEVGVLWLNW